MLCGNDYFIICHLLTLFQRENFKPCSALQQNSVRTSTQNCAQLAQDSVANSKHTKQHAQEEKRQARCFNQDLKSTPDACFTSQTRKSTINAEWAKMLQANNLGEESSEMVWFKPTKIKAGVLNYLAKHCGISLFLVISWKAQTQWMNIKFD